MDTPKMRSAFAILGLLVIVLVGGLLTYGGVKVYSAFAPGRPQKQAIVIDNSARDAQIAAQKAQAALQDEIAANKSALAAEQAKNQLAAGPVGGIGLVLAMETKPSMNVQIASTLQQQAAKILDPATVAQIDEYQLIVKQLQDTNDKQSAALDESNKQIAQAKIDTESALQKAVQSDVKAQDTAAKNVTLSAKNVSLTDQFKAWTEEQGGLLSRIRSLTIGIIVIVSIIALIGWILPLIGKAFPAFAPVAKVISAPFLLILHLLHEGEKDLLSAAHNVTKTALASTQAQLTEANSATKTATAALVQVASATVAPTAVPAKS